MTRQRGLFLALALGALLSLTGREANAGNLTITVSWTGGSTSVTFTDPQAVPGGTANSFAIDPTLLNAAVAASGYAFTELGGSSNNPGDPGGSILRLTGTAFLNGSVPPPSALTVEALQTEFTSPSGPGTLSTQATGNFRNAAAGTSQASSAALDATTVTILPDFTPPVASDTATTAAVGSASGYTLSAKVVITLVGPTGLGGVSDQFSNNVSFGAVPEPASLVMMLTGMPLPLVVMGLFRRRRAAAA